MRAKHSRPHGVRFQPRNLRVLEEIAEEVGLRSIGAANNLLIHWAERVRKGSELTWSDLLFTKEAPDQEPAAPAASK